MVSPTVVQFLFVKVFFVRLTLNIFNWQRNRKNLRSPVKFCATVQLGTVYVLKQKAVFFYVCHIGIFCRPFFVHYCNKQQFLTYYAITQVFLVTKQLKTHAQGLK